MVYLFGLLALVLGVYSALEPCLPGLLALV